MSILAKGRTYHVEILEHEYPEWNKHFDFDDLEKALAYCKELDFQGYEFSLDAYNKYEDNIGEA